MFGHFLSSVEDIFLFRWQFPSFRCTCWFTNIAVFKQFFLRLLIIEIILSPKLKQFFLRNWNNSFHWNKLKHFFHCNNSFSDSYPLSIFKQFFLRFSSILLLVLVFKFMFYWSLKKYEKSLRFWSILINMKKIIRKIWKHYWNNIVLKFV